MKKLFLGVACLLASAQVVQAADYSPESYIQEGLRFEKRGQYFQAARYYFQAQQRATDEGQRAVTSAYISNALAAQGLYQSASYFFLKAISSGNDRVIRLALNSTQGLIDNVGGVIFKKYLLKYTKEDQYPRSQRDYYLHFLAQDHLQALRPHDVIRSVNDIDRRFLNYPSSLFLRGTAYLLLGQVNEGVTDFRACANMADKVPYTKNITKQEARELKNRCLAGVARGIYQGKKYNDAELAYEAVEMDSFSWPQVQYERAWTAIARGDYNRALGRLVTYKAPALTWFHDSEVEMLRAISYLQMCIYEDVDKEANIFMAKYGKVGQEIKSMLEASADGNTRELVKLFQRGVEAMKSKIQSEDPIHQVMNRFVRSPYFVQLAYTGEKVRKEYAYLNRIGDAGRRGIGGFLRDVLIWRWQTAQEVGGIFVRDRLSTEYKNLLANVATIDIVKLEMLRRAKARAEAVSSTVNEGVDVWGNRKKGSLGKPYTRRDQYFWDFNGEFWTDELGDYVFALRPECY